jgi:hypothetical protein
VTPEERLLRLIESGAQSGKRFALWDVHRWAPFFVPYQERARRLVRSWFAGRVAPRELNLQLINRGLGVLLVLVVAAMALNTQRARPRVTDLSRPARSAGLAANAEPPSSVLRPVEDYLKDVEQRDLFNPVAVPERGKTEAKTEPMRPPEPVKSQEPTALDVLREKAKTLKLVGISWGPVPVAMIEDTATRETVFVKERGVINQLRIKAIFRDRVVLTYAGADYDLF